MHDLFRKIATHISSLVGTSHAFLIAFTVIIIWAISGSIFNYSNTWQLVINTFTTIITFLMVFLIQNTQNRDAKAVHIKLDELLKGVKGARTSMVDVENLSDTELESLHLQFQKIHEHYAKALATRMERKRMKLENTRLQKQSNQSIPPTNQIPPTTNI